MSSEWTVKKFPQGFHLPRSEDGFILVRSEDREYRYRTVDGVTEYQVARTVGLPFPYADPMNVFMEDLMNATAGLEDVVADFTPAGDYENASMLARGWRAVSSTEAEALHSINV